MDNSIPDDVAALLKELDVQDTPPPRPPPERELLCSMLSHHVQALTDLAATLPAADALSLLSRSLPNHIDRRTALAQELLCVLRHIVGTDPFSYLQVDILASNLLQFFTVWELFRLRSVSKLWRCVCERALAAAHRVDFAKVPSLDMDVRTHEGVDYTTVGMVVKHCSALDTVSMHLGAQKGYSTKNLQTLLEAMTHRGEWYCQFLVHFC